MTAGWPTKVTYADGDVFSASDINSTNGTLNYIDPTSATDGQVLTRDAASGGKVKWATPSSGGMTLLSTTNLSGTSVTVSSISQAYTQLFVTVAGVAFGGGSAILQLQANGSSTASYTSGFDAAAGASFTSTAGNVMQAGALYPVYNILLPNYADTTIGKNGWGSSGAGAGSAKGIFSYFYDSASAITSLKISANGSTFSQGFVKIWGIK